MTQMGADAERPGVFSWPRIVTDSMVWIVSSVKLLRHYVSQMSLRSVVVATTVGGIGDYLWDLRFSFLPRMNPGWG